MTYNTKSLILLALLLVSAARVDAAIVTLTAQGSISLVTPGLATAFSPGTLVTYQLTYDTNGVDLSANPNVGGYLTAISSYSVTVGSSYAASSPAGTIQLQDNAGGGIGDTFSAGSFVADGLVGPSVNGLTLSRIYFQLWDTQAA